MHSGVLWYLVAFDRDRDDGPTFRVDRIAGAPTAGAGATPVTTTGGWSRQFLVWMGWTSR